MTKEMTVVEIIEFCKTVKSQSFYDEYMFHELDINSYDFEIEDWEEFDKTLYQKYFDTWTCWDTLVGKSVVYLNDEPVCITSKSARKAETRFYWLGKEQMHKTREYLLSLVKQFEEKRCKFISTNTPVPIEGEEIGDSKSANSYRKG